ncbi:hydroxyacid dehydrogenase [Lentzea aerocolonigenes]|uniref:Hydroxyacid dehydrogenase n=1 Tax=Lentzea aerocolonigenes TaxID=68170 RepID=A0A0F0GKX9_LENAE|nr:D-glycerate dehydrogenase [Lentzea aerocolonigenes]KJK42627.1 hydroxyacid dehydrogenase [Lentzea aerocolonigenes]
MARIFISRPRLPGAGVDLLASRFQVAQWRDDAVPGADDLRNLVRGCDGALLLGNDRVDAALLDAAGDGLRVIALASAGFDAVDQEAARARKVVVTHTPGVLAESTADIAFSLMLMARRRLGAAVDELRAGGWRSFQMDGYLGLDVHGATLGLIGYGQIARAVARRAAGFGMPVQHYSRTRRSDMFSRPVGLEELLRTSDIVSLHVPLTPETTGLIGARELALMKPTATLVNTARGAVVDESALLAALRTGALHSAGLDVMNGEPRCEPTDPLFAEPNLVVLPHVGSATERTRAAMVELAARNLLAVLGGEPAPTPLPGTPATY